MKIINLRTEYLVNPLGIDHPRPRLSWCFALESDTDQNEQQIAYQIIVSDSPEGVASLKAHSNIVWDSGIVSSDHTTQIEYCGPTLKTHQRYYWKVHSWDNQGHERDSLEDFGATFWQAGLMSPADWHAQWISLPTEDLSEVEVIDTTKPKPVKIKQGPPAPMFRKQFQSNKKVKSAFLYATALGEYEVTINGQRVGDRYLTPEWTEYQKRLLYQVYDVSGLINAGANIIGAVVGDGWYLGLLGPGDTIRQRYYGNKRKFACQLVLTYEDGSHEEICTDKTWKLFRDGPIRSSDHFMGEFYDTTKSIPGWDKPGYSDIGWEAVTVDTELPMKLEAQYHEPVQVHHTLTPIRVTETLPGVYIFNLGQNLVGWCELRVNGKEGQKIRVRHGEMLELDGTLHVDNLRLAAQTDTFILNGKGLQTLHPHFTFHGFQYVEITGLTSKPGLDFLVGKAISSNPPVVGAFECSSPMLNKLWNNILWTQRDNMDSIPTDCPQRNERMGWMGDAQVFAQTAILNMDMAAFFSKFTTDMRDAQGEEGQYTDFAPHPFPSKTACSFGPGWADCGIIIPWRLYQAYGDKRVLENHYDSMKQYVDLISDENPKYLWEIWGSNYGDWLHGDTLKAKGYPEKGGEMPKDVYASTFFFLSASLLGKIAAVLGKSEDARRYQDMAMHVKDAFNAKYVDKKGKIKGDTQSAYAIALGFGLLPENVQPLALKHMLKAIEKYKGRISTGFISTIQMMMQLSGRGENALAYQLVESTRFPSWGYTIEQGATSIWERWDGFVTGRGFQNKGMNSFNHYSIGSVGEWLYRNVLGINFDDDKPGMTHCIIQPRPGGTLTAAKGHYISIHGKISVDWRISNGFFDLKVEIPPNTTANVILPGKGSEKVNSGIFSFHTILS